MYFFTQPSYLMNFQIVDYIFSFFQPKHGIIDQPSCTISSTIPSTKLSLVHPDLLDTCNPLDNYGPSLRRY